MGTASKLNACQCSALVLYGTVRSKSLFSENTTRAPNPAALTNMVQNKRIEKHACMHVSDPSSTVCWHYTMNDPWKCKATQMRPWPFIQITHCCNQLCNGEHSGFK